MSGRNYKIFVESVFAPLVSAADRPDLIPHLKTADLSPERRASQFAKFKALQIDKSKVVYLPNGGFVAILELPPARLVAISSAGMNSQDEDLLEKWAIDAGLTGESVDESTFLFIAHVLKGYLRLRDEYRAKQSAEELIDIVDENYDGHVLDDLIKIYRPVYIYELSAESALFDEDIFSLACDLCVSNPSLRSQMIDEDFNSQIVELLQYPSIDRSNIFQALTSAHWRYVFLEFFRIIEAILYLPWVLDFKGATGISSRAYDLKSSCRLHLKWRENQRASMEKLFAMVEGDANLDYLENGVECFTDIKNGKDFKRSQLGSRVYTIRNSLVHHEDFEDDTPYVNSDEQWRSLSLYMAYVLNRIFEIHSRDLTPADR